MKYDDQYYSFHERAGYLVKAIDLDHLTTCPASISFFGEKIDYIK